MAKRAHICAALTEEPAEEPGYTRFVACTKPVYRFVHGIPFCREAFESRHSMTDKRYVQTVEEYEEMVTIEYVQKSLAKD